MATECNLLALNKPEVRLTRLWEKFDDQGCLADEQARGQLRALLEALAAWTRRLRGD